MTHWKETSSTQGEIYMRTRSSPVKTPRTTSARQTKGILTDVVSDLTKINIEIDFTLDTADVVLLVATGGIGYLGKQFYHHVSTRNERRRELELKNYEKLIDLATARRA